MARRRRYYGRHHRHYRSHRPSYRPYNVPTPEPNALEYVQSPEPEVKEQTITKQSSNKVIIYALLSLVALTVILVFIASKSSHLSLSINTPLSQGIEGSQSSPFQPNFNHTITWKGPGYYLIPSNIPASGLKQGINKLSNQSQVYSYNQWVSQTQPSTTVASTSTTVSISYSSTVAPLVLSTIPASNQTNWSQSISGVVHSIGSGVGSFINTVNPNINATWVRSFFSIVNADRLNSSDAAIAKQYGVNATLTYCPYLSNIAKSRFSIMTAGNNYYISHYGAENISHLQTFEEVLYPDGFTPSDYAQNMQTSAPLHWAILTDISYGGTYIGSYGYYLARGPTIETEGSCSVTEIPGPNINVWNFFEQNGCAPTTGNATWFVLELAPACVDYPIYNLTNQ